MTAVIFLADFGDGYLLSEAPANSIVQEDTPDHVSPHSGGNDNHTQHPVFSSRFAQFTTFLNGLSKFKNTQYLYHSHGVLLVRNFQKFSFLFSL